MEQREHFVTFLLSVCFFLAFFNCCVAQEETFLPLYPQEDAAACPDVVESLAQSLKPAFFASLFSYAAVRYNDEIYCKDLRESHHCFDGINEIRAMRAFAQGRCQELPEPWDFITDVCRALGEENCEGLQGSKKKICIAFMHGDIDSYSTAMKDPFILAHLDKEEDEDLALYLALYNGFKYNSDSQCSNFLDDVPYSMKLSCRMLFGAVDPETLIEQIALDLAYFLYSMTYDDESSCEKIKDTFIKNHCENASADSFWKFVEDEFDD